MSPSPSPGMVSPVPRGGGPFFWRVVVRPHLGSAMFLLLLMLGNSLLEAMTVGLAVPLLDAVTDPARAAGHGILQLLARGLGRLGVSASPNALVFALMVVACGLFLIRGAMAVAYQCATAATAYRLRRRTKAALLDRVLRAPYETVTRQARGVVVHQINDPADSLHTAIMNAANFVAGTLDCLFLVGLMLYLSWWATIGVALLALAGVQGWRRFADRRAAADGKTLFMLRGEQAKVEVDAIDGLRVTKAHGLEGAIVERQRALLQAERVPTLRFVLYRATPTFVNELIASAIVIGLGAVTFLVPSLGIRFSMLIAFLMAVRRVAPAMAKITGSSAELQRCRRSLEVMEATLNQLPQEAGGHEAVPPVDSVALADVHFRYASRPEYPVLGEVSLVARRGAVTALVGPTGAGKSTLAGLLVRLYEPTAGAILVNGRPLRTLDLAAWRQKVGYVSQDLFVFNATIRENITLWGHIPEAEVLWAARVAQLHDLVETLPNGYDTVVGDRGLRLSGGQCQRLAIARAIVRHPEVLIFDEATSALDNVTERAVFDAISAVHREAVVLVVAHRLSTVRDADQIVVLKAGRIVEVGTHASLIRQAGDYARLYQEHRQPDAVGAVS